MFCVILDCGSHLEGLHVTISPNMCAVISLDEQHIASLDTMQLNSADVALGDAETLEAVNEAFVLQGSLAILNPITYSDDLLATLETFTSQHLFQETLQGNPAESFKWRFLSEVYRLLGLQYDYSLNAQDNSLLKAAVIQRCLSLQASLGFNGTRNVPPSLSSQVAQSILDLRFVAYALMMAKKSRTEGKPGSWM